MSCKPDDERKMWEIVRPDGLMVFKPMTMTASDAVKEVMNEYLEERS